MVPAVEVANAAGTSPYVLLCEHASNLIPASYRGLGLPPHELERHIAWDIGAAAVARHLARLLDAPLVLAGYSRLLVDCNRPLEAPSAIPVRSETTIIPGNQDLSDAERQQRARDFYWPFQQAVTHLLDERQASGHQTLILGIHSFTPIFHGQTRPWHAGVLFRQAHHLGEGLVAALQAPNLVVAANEPYQIEDDSDYSVPVHGETRGLPAALIEIRQDLVTDQEGQIVWAERLARACQSYLRGLI